MNKSTFKEQINSLNKSAKRAELKQNSLYKITKAAHNATNLKELYTSLHSIISKLIYSDNFYIAIYDDLNE